MIKYFKELLTTLKNILALLISIDRRLKELESCVVENNYRYGEYRKYIASGHWNE